MTADEGRVRQGEAAIAVLLAPFSRQTWLAAASLALSVLIGTWLFPLTAVAQAGAAMLTRVPRAGATRHALAVGLPARLARIDRRRVLSLNGIDIRAHALPDSPRPAWYQIARFPVALALAGIAYLWWANNLLLLLLPFLAQRRFPIVLYGWHFGDIALSPSGVTAGLVLGILLAFVGVQVLSSAAAIDAALARALLGPSRESAQIARLTRARAMAVEAAESERRRIERDLHDGFQPRLVSLAAQIGLAMLRFERDPAAARATLAQAHAEAKAAMADLRGVIRGLHPPVLDERGLDAALSGLIVGCPIPVRVQVSLSQRPDPMHEAITYFVAAEAITNITRHSGAHQAAVTITDTNGPLTIQVEDDGRGGAAAVPGGGLAGLAARVGAADGTLKVTSPPGGPTSIEAVLG